MYSDRCINNPSRKVLNINSVVEPITCDSTTEIKNLKHQPEQQPAVQTINEIWDDFLTQPTDDSCGPFSILAIKKQPRKLHHFRFEREIEKESHGYLLGIDSAGRNLNTFTTVELRTHRHAKDEKYFIRCTLHQPLRNGPEQSSFISPHKLCRRDDKFSWTGEVTLFSMVKVAPHCFQFKLENFFISRSITNKYLSNCQDKYKLLQKQNDSKLRLVMPTDKDKIESKQVQIGFEAFKLMDDGSYTHVLGPIFSDCITNGEPLKIKRINNSHGHINGGVEVILLVRGCNSKMKMSIEIDDTLGWHKSIHVNKTMLLSQAVITFQTPKYDNDLNQNEQQIRCEIRLKREIDDEISNVQYFTYIRTLKKRSDEIFPLNETQCKVKKPEQQSPPEQSCVLINMDKYETDSVVEIGHDSCKVIKEPINKATILDETLHDICFIYKEAEIVCSEEKLEYSKHVRQYFDYYVQESPCRNSILHDILQDVKYQRYEMKLYKIIQHFELKNLIRDSKNIYGETPLMFACMFNKPQLIRALINMECPIQARNDVEGNNVLHLISQHQSTEECRKSVIEAVKDSHNEVVIAGFIKAMKHTNFNGLTPLHFAVQNDNVELVTEFLGLCQRHNALYDIISCGKLTDGNTILHLAVLKKSEEMYSHILKYVSDIKILNLQNFAGITAAGINRSMEKPLISRCQRLQ